MTKKNNKTPKNQKPKAKLHMSMRDFSFFGKDNDAVITEMKTILDSGHSLTLNMTQSTSLSSDLWVLNQTFYSSYEVAYRHRKDDYNKAYVAVILQKPDESDRDEERLQELIGKARNRYLGDADWNEVLEYLHEDDREEYEKLYGELR